MTVCVALICERNIIFGASDRMLTAGDIEFEPPAPKIFPLTSSIIAMTAGDANLQAEILSKVGETVAARIQANPANWWRVEDVANLYASEYDAARRRRSDHALLAPLGLSHETFLARQAQLLPDFVRMISTELINFSIPPVETLFVGIDEMGTHIFQTVGSSVTCHDSVGFAAIGVGAAHALSQVMFAGHAVSSPLPESLLLAYSAKKRAEVAPGVGGETDMFTIGPQLGSYSPLGNEVKAHLQKIYDRTRRTAAKADVKARREVTQYVEDLRTAPAQAQAVPEDSSGDEAAHDETAAVGTPDSSGTPE